MAADSFFNIREKMARPTRPAPAPPDPSAPPLSVSAVTKLVDSAIRRGTPASLLVRGEVSNFNFNRASGHAYFTLKDSAACLNCVMFASDFSLLKFRPEHGMEVVAGGQVKIFAAQGKYQLYVSTLQPVGHGALELAFRQLREKLEAEGLFATARKRLLPAYPVKIAIVTSRETAALADILKVLRPYPWVRVALFHSPVQGDLSGPALAAAVELVGRAGPLVGYDLILLGRGGGSLEDLWGFNDQRLARAIAGSLLPVVTGIGHEVDVSIADLVADHHAHTPTEAARVVTAGWASATALLRASVDRLHRSARNQVSGARQRLQAIERHDIFRRPSDRLNDLRQQLDHTERALQLSIHRRLQSTERRVLALRERLDRQSPTQQVAARLRRLLGIEQRLRQSTQRVVRQHTDRLIQIEHRLAGRSPQAMLRLLDQTLSTADHRLGHAQRVNLRQAQRGVDAISQRLEALSPLAVLKRGYSVTRLKKSGVIIRSATQVPAYAALVTRVTDGEIESTAGDPQQPQLFE